MNPLLIADPFRDPTESGSPASPGGSACGEFECTGKFRRIAWLLILFAFGRLIISTFFGPMSDHPAMHFELTAPYLFFVVAVFLIRTDRMARWASGVAAFLAVIT